MAEINKTRKSRTIIRGAFTRSANEFEQLLSVGTVDLHKIQVLWELLHVKFVDLKVIDSRLYEMLLDEATEEELLAEIGFCDVYKMRFIDLKLRFEKLVENRPTGRVQVGAGQASIVSSESVAVNPKQTVEYHLSKCLQKSTTESTSYTSHTIENLQSSFYVDNCVASISNEESLSRFIEEATLVIKEGKFELRGWEYTRNCSVHVPVLGLKWNLGRNTLALSTDWMKDTFDIENTPVTKRLILSMAHRVFDSIGFTCVPSLVPKLWLQKLWEKNLPWDAPINDDIELAFRNWVKELPGLSGIEIPRWIGYDKVPVQYLSVHTFCDASKNAFCCVIFLRVEETNSPRLHLLAAKSRVAPLRKLTIPRLELLAAGIAARLYASVIQNLEGEISSYFWTDSSTVLAWIQRNETWATYVWNRIAEIRALAPSDAWKYIPGDQNPANLPSRGCSPRQLLESRWWEGPGWLLENPRRWPCSVSVCGEDEINDEKKKLVTALLNGHSEEWHLTSLSSYASTLKMIALICLYTCAVYRAVHLELCTSLSAPCFMQTFRRFVARRGRLRTIYCDNGRNFVGAEDALSLLDWEVIERRTSVQLITWFFDPPTAAWWGGFWERLVGVMKRLLRIVLGRSCLNYEDLTIVLCDSEAVINSRPLTYVSNDPSDAVPLTPSMFLRDQIETGLPDCDTIDRNSLCRKLRHKQKLREDLRRRFGSEYLGQLKLRFQKRTSRPVKLGEIVLVGNDNDKRIDWPW